MKFHFENLGLLDVYDRAVGQFWSSSRRNPLASGAGLATVQQVLHGKATDPKLEKYVGDTASRYRAGALKALVIRREFVEWCDARAKLVRPAFTQAIDTHWRKPVMEWNRVVDLSEAPE